MKVGDVCMKIAGRDAGQICAIVSVEKDGYVMIDGATRRRKCNTCHLEPMGKQVKLKSGASHADVVKALVEFGVVEKKTKTKDKKAKPVTKRVQKAVAKKTAKVVKKVKKKAKK